MKSSNVKITKQLSPVKAFIAISLCLHLFSCDKEHVKDYYVTNNLQDSLLIRYQVLNSDTVTSIIRLHENKLLFSDSYVMGTVGVDDDRNALAIQYIGVIINNDTIALPNSLWLYEQIDKYHVAYTVVLDSTSVH